MKENQENQSVILYEHICHRLTTGGITREELSPINHLPIGCQSVEKFIEANVSVGNYEWRDDLLVNADRKLEIKLTKEEEGKLLKKAEEAGLSAGEFVRNIVSEFISE